MKKNFIYYITYFLICSYIILNAVFSTPANKKSQPIQSTAVAENTVIENLTLVNAGTSQVVNLAKSQATLQITTPNTSKLTTEKSAITFKGKANKKYSLTLNGEKIKVNKDGSFKTKQKLKLGKNKFVFKNKGVQKTFTITRNLLLVKEFSPEKTKTYKAGGKIKVKVTARSGSVITATLHNVKITLKQTDETAKGFTEFTGTFNLPSTPLKKVNFGKIKYKCVFKNYKKTFYSEEIFCKAAQYLESDKSVTPNEKPYTDVGSGVIAEIVGYEAETFTGSNNDLSKPYNNYLPKGTIDYASLNHKTIKRDGEELKLVKLRCGRTVYLKKTDKVTDKTTKIVSLYGGTLPESNSLEIAAFKTGSTHTVLALSSDWKAPFFLKLKKQEYDKKDFSIDKVTYTYVDITFCYAASLKGDPTVPKDNPLFSKAKIIKNKSDYTLRLYLKKKGGFYGWTCYYNSKGQLCFKFLNPVKIKLANNKYGADLTGARILIDVGHGGKDCGAIGVASKKYYEAAANLKLAKKIKKELQSIGATVYLTRTKDVLSTADDKIKMLKSLKPDYCIAIHHDSAAGSSANGFGAYYFHPFSKNASKLVLNQTAKTNIYKRETFKRHYYFMARSSVCPVVLTENGFMSSRYDYNKIKNSSVNTKKAIAITKGIADYFISIQ